MEEAGRIVEEILRHLKAEGSLRKEDIKDKLGVEEERIEGILQFLRELKLIEGDNEMRITKVGLEYLKL
jgi:predicted ArsR family transcriptional regulator